MDAIDHVELARLATLVPAIWPLPKGVQLTSLTAGTNNLVLRVDGPDGGTHILRLYRNHANAARVRHELALLTALHDQPLPIAVPAAVDTRAGVPFAKVEFAEVSGVQVPALAILWTYLPGRHPNPEDAILAEAAGATLAVLDRALAGVDPSVLPGQPTPPLGDLRRRIPLLEDVADALRALPLPASDVEELLRQWHTVEEQAPPLYAHLPHQLIHGDFDPSNVLFEGGRVSGVLDFEFNGVDLRVVDLAIPLTWWPLRQFGTGAEWAILDAIGRGYTAHLPLLPTELEALPTLFRLRAIGGLLHRVARYRQGLLDLDALLARAATTIERERWLQRNEGQLLAMVRRWQRVP